MLVGFFILNKRYSPLEYLSSLLMSSGLIAFTLADQSVTPEFNFTGIILVISSVIMEAVFSNLQQKFMQHWKCPHTEMVFWSNIFGTIQVFILLLFSGEFFIATQFCMEHPQAYFAIAAEATIGYLGVIFYLGLVKRFGAVTAVFVGCCRSVATILLSFLFFPKPWTILYLIASIMVSIALILNGYSNQKEKTSKSNVKNMDSKEV